jgi:small subunit ribosomal protein S16
MEVSFMSVVIRLMRAGAKKRPFFRMVAADSRRQRDGRFLEILGHYNPLTQPYELVVHKDKVEVWLSRGAQPSEQVASLLRSLGISKHRPSDTGLADAPAPAAAMTEKPAKRAEKPAKVAKSAKSAASAKRAVARKPSERKTRAKAARKATRKPAAKA